MKPEEICLLNDAFPPLIDGVANVVTNYARVIHDSGTAVSVVTPECPGADDSGFPYPVIRYPSLDARKQLGYPIGNPFSIPTLLELKSHPIRLLHSHCPAASNLLGRELRDMLDVPLVMTYHTKYDIDIANVLHGHAELLQEGAIRALVESVSAVDELWTVSRGAGENIRKLGYEGDYVVMENGVDMPRHRADEALIRDVTAGFDLPEGIPLFLFVGRLMWYKGLRIILEALAALSSQDLDYRMVFVGGGGDEAEVKALAEELKLGNKCFFIGPVRDRERLVAWYSRANLFLFPSTFDTNGLVIREAAACSLGAVMIKGSCAAEGVTAGQNGLLIEENAASLAVCLTRLLEHPEKMRAVGEYASAELYLSWNEAVKKAMERYETVIDRYRSGKRRPHHRPGDELLRIHSNVAELYARLEEAGKEWEKKLLE